MTVSGRDRVLDATLAVVRDDGIAGVSARAIARAGGFSQALVFYHFDTIEDLLVAACAAGAADRVRQWQEQLDRVATFTDLVDLAEILHSSEDDRGNVTVLAQFLAGAQTHPGLAAATGAALDGWLAQVRPVVNRLLGGTVIETLVAPDDLAAVVVDAFVGMELAASTRGPAELARRLATLRRLAGLVEVFNDLGPVASGLVHRRVARHVAPPA